jgi:hypothetical protein
MITNNCEKETGMKRMFIAFMVLAFLAAFGSAAFAEEKVVQLTMPGCAA